MKIFVYLYTISLGIIWEIVYVLVIIGTGILISLGVGLLR